MKVTNIITTDEAQKGFYPTPPDIADKLLAGIDWEYIESVLEPSAGKGNLIDGIARSYQKNKYSYERNRLDVDCIEIDPHLRSILKYEWGDTRENEIMNRLRVLKDKQEYNSQTRCYEGLTNEEKTEEHFLKIEIEKINAVDIHVVHDDFMTFSSRKNYDLIVMNPPFEDGDAHLFRALEIAEKNGAEIRCILNAETLLNPYTNRRKALVQKLGDMNADVTYTDEGFCDAERKTNVSIAIIKIKVEKKEKKSEIFERLKRASDYDETKTEAKELALVDFIGNYVARFNLEIDAGIKLIDEYNAMSPYILKDLQKNSAYNYPILTLGVGGTITRGDKPSKNEFVCAVRKKYWKFLFHNHEFMSRMTTNIREKYIDMVNELKNYDFTIFNIQQILAQMGTELSQGIEQTIVALFDKMTAEYTWYPEMQKNIHYFNGWKTNKAHKVNNKVILPIYGMFANYSWIHEPFRLDEAERTISDIEKVFCYLDGDMYAQTNLYGILKTAHSQNQTKNIKCKYFSVTLYKKGTMHIKFYSQDIVDRFNIYCCIHKKWLPPFYGKRKYDNIPKEQQQIIDEFQGKDAYNEVMCRAEYFLSPVSHGKPFLALENR